MTMDRQAIYGADINRDVFDRRLAWGQRLNIKAELTLDQIARAYSSQALRERYSCLGWYVYTA